jgi:predicted N-formylglutamate amidohydrolase
LIRDRAGGAPIPGNAGLDSAAVRARLDRFYAGYHAAVDRELGRLVSRFGPERVVFFSFHSFTGSYGGEDRDFDAGVLFDACEDLAAGVKRALATRGLRTRLNEPYSGFRGEIYAASVHAEAHDVATFEIELNQDVLEDVARREGIARVFASVVPAIFPHLPCRPRHNGPVR